MISRENLKRKMIEDFKREEEQRFNEFKQLHATIENTDTGGVESVFRRRKRSKQARPQPVVNLSSTIGKMKAVHKTREYNLQKTMAKVDMDKVILMKEKLKTTLTDKLF